MFTVYVCFRCEHEFAHFYWATCEKCGADTYIPLDFRTREWTNKVIAKPLGYFFAGAVE